MPRKSDDDDEDVYDELLALAEPRKRRQASSSSKSGSSSKRRKQEAAVESDDDPESEEDESNPYPLAGQYKDEADRQKLMELSEIEREEIIAQRLEERQRLVDKANLNRLFKASAAAEKEKDSVSKAAKRKHISTGQTREKAQGLAALTEQRRAKKERASKKGRAGSSSPVRRRTPSPSEESTDEDGQISKAEQEELDYASKSKAKSDVITLEDVRSVQLTRDMLAKACVAPWFEDYVKGTFVRYLIGIDENRNPAYRLCEVVNVGSDLVKNYQINQQTVNQLLELKHGSSQKSFAMDKVSNSPVDQREFDRFLKTCEAEKVKLPTASKLEKKKQQLDKLANQKFTEADITAMVARKAQLHANQPNSQQVLAEKARLVQLRNVAVIRKDAEETEDLSRQLRELQDQHPDLLEERREAPVETKAFREEKARKHNLELIRKAEEAERERRRKLVQESPARGTPPIGPVAVDLSARVKIMPRLRHNANSRSGTPGAPKPQAPAVNGLQASQQSTSVPSSFEALVNSVEVDLGDF